jgi:hypothetical protein
MPTSFTEGTFVLAFVMTAFVLTLFTVWGTLRVLIYMHDRRERKNVGRT